MPDSLENYPISTDSYIHFDGVNLKEALKNRLNQTGLFTDQNFEGSNLAHYNEIVSYLFSMLLFYLNQQSNDGVFTEVQLYENINKLVKKLDYKPIGHQTATLAFEASVKDLVAGLYTIPRYSYIEVGGIKYSFNEDITFSKTINMTEEKLVDMSKEKLLYQGTFIEHPLIVATGNENELIFLTVDDSVIIDHFNTDVYVKDAITSKWTKWELTTSLYLNRANEYKYELRYNENKRYELKFGNNINGRKLNSGDKVAIYYLKTDGSKGEVGANVLPGKSLIFYKSNRLNEIIADISPETSALPFSPNSTLSFINKCTSSSYSLPESVEDIRQNAPGVYRSQFRVVTSNDYESFVKTNFSNLIYDVKAYNNSKYLNRYLQYFTNLGLLDSNQESRALFNQVNFADSCNFNNVYLFVVPKTVGNSLSYVNPSQKSLIIDTIREEKVLTSETIILDPVYLAFDIALGGDSATKIQDRNHTVLKIEKTSNSRRSDESIRAEVSQKIQNYFLRKHLKLGQTIDLNQLTTDILNTDGVRKIFTSRSDINSQVEGIRLISWNPAYGDISLENVVTNLTIEEFQFPYLINDIDFNKKIVIQSNNTKYEGVEY
jgi:hypothetical protein